MDWDGANRQRDWTIWVALLGGLAALILLSGCFNPGITSRTGDLLDPGEIGGGAAFTVFGFAPGEVTLADGDTASGNTGQRYKPHPLAYMAPHIMNTQAALYVGVADGFQMGVSAGMQQLGGELRVALADEDDQDPVSLALGLSGMWRPFAQLDGPWVGLTLDLSRRVRPNLALFVDHGLSFGPEEHAVGLESHQDRECGGFGEEGCGEYGPPRQFRVTRRELRANFALGVARRIEDTGGAWVVSVTPYATIWGDDEGAALECLGCSYLTPVAFVERWGVHLSVGYQFTGW